MNRFRSKPGPCYRRLKLLTNNPWREKLSQSIDEGCLAVGSFLAAFVYMPEHVHLLVWGITTEKEVSELLSRVKQPVSVQVHADLAQRQSRLLPRLTVRDRPGRQVFRFWQEREGQLMQVTGLMEVLDLLSMGLNSGHGCRFQGCLCAIRRSGIINVRDGGGVKISRLETAYRGAASWPETLAARG